MILYSMNLRGGSSFARKAVFFDRDGVINKKAPPHDYVKSWEEFEFLPQVFSSLKAVRDKDYLIFIISNQAGVARGFLSLDDLEQIHRRMEEEFRRRGVEIAKVYFCPHGYQEGCLCRKPKPGMLLEATKDFGLDLKKSFLVGDSKADVAAARAAGCKTILTLTGETQDYSEVNNWDLKPDFTIPDLTEIKKII